MPIPSSPNSAGVRRNLLHEQVYAILLAEIADGSLQPGDRLDDEELGSWLEVSRTPIRQALGRLIDIGLVEMRPNRFTRVAVPDPGQFLHRFEVVSALWKLAAQKTTGTLTDDDVDEFSLIAHEVHALTAQAPLTTIQGARLVALILAGAAFFVSRTGNDVLDQTTRRVETQVAHIARSGATHFNLPLIQAVFDQLQRGVSNRDCACVLSALDELCDGVARELEARMRADQRDTIAGTDADTRSGDVPRSTPRGPASSRVHRQRVGPTPAS